MATEVQGLAELTSAQANKFITYNANLRQMEAMTIRVKSKANGGPPASPTSGDAYIVDVATGAWASFTVNNIAQSVGGVWYQYTRAEGLRVWLMDTDKYNVYNGSAWVELTALSLGISSFTAASVPFLSSSGTLLEDNTNFNYVNSTDTLNIKNLTVLSTGALTVNGSATMSAITASGLVTLNGATTASAITATSVTSSTLTTNDGLVVHNLKDNDTGAWELKLAGVANVAKLSTSTGNRRFAFGQAATTLNIDFLGNGTINYGTGGTAGYRDLATNTEYGPTSGAWVFQSGNTSTGTMSLRNTSGTEKISLNLLTGAVTTAEKVTVTAGGVRLPSGATDLTWYEEGTFTPEVYGSSSAGTGTYNGVTAGKFTRIGNVVVFLITYDLTSHTGTGNLRVRTLPYAASSNTVVNVFVNNLTFPNTHMQWFIVGQEVWANNVSSGGGDAYIALDTAHQAVISGYYLV